MVICESAARRVVAPDGSRCLCPFPSACAGSADDAPAFVRMKPVRLRALRGPNVYATLPVLRAEIAPGGERPVDGDVADRLLAALPGLAAHPDLASADGATVEARLRAGASAALVVGHVARELLHLAGAGVPFEAPRLRVPAGHAVVPFTDEAPARQALTEAAALVAAAETGEPDVEAAIEAVRRRVRRAALGPSTRALVDAAERRGIPWERLDDDSLVRLGNGRHARWLRAAVTSVTSALGTDLAQRKDLTKQALRRALVPVPYGIVAADEDEAVDALDDLRRPVVVKPLRGNHGRGVTVGVETAEHLREAFALAREHGCHVVVEEQLDGRDYRVLVVGGRVVAAAERCPCHVVGDGRRTIAELIDEANADPRRGVGHEAPLTRIATDATAEACLARQGLTLDAVPDAGATVRLSDAANLSTGGTSRDVTDELHPDVRVACERAARAVGLDVCGVDLITADVRRSLRAGREGIVEVNASPGLRMHLYPAEGRPRDVAGAIIDHLYPDGAPSRVPIVALTGTNGKTTTTRLVRHVLCKATGLQVGMTTTSGVWVGDTCIATGDTTGPASAGAVLADPTVDIAVLETARGGLLRRGLGYDLADVAVVTNVREDHLGQDGIETLDDVIAVKSIVAERVRDGGTLVVNADDEGAMRLLGRLDLSQRACRVALFATDAANPAVRRHLSDGGTAYTVRDGCIVETSWSGETDIVRVDRVPITLGGMADFQVENVLATVAACRALGVPSGAIADALRLFDAADNEGRFNVYRLGQGHVVVDYGHTADAFEAIGRLLRRWRPGVPSIGVVSAPGDRSDDLIRSAGAAAAGAFSTLVLCDDRDRRGRAIGETVALLREGATRARPDVPVEVEVDEAEALRSVLDRVRGGHVAVVFYESLPSLVAILVEAGAVPLAGTVAADSEPVRTRSVHVGRLSGDGVGPVEAPLPALVPRPAA